MFGLPEVVQSQILASFCDGKSISTYFHAILCSESSNPIAFDLVRDALVHRYKNLASMKQLGDQEEVRDVLDIIREEIRTCKVIKTTSGSVVINDSDTSFRESLSTKISDYCAIVDYFDKTRMQELEKSGEFVLWNGELRTQGGRIRNASLSTKIWSITAMDFFHDQLELYNDCFTHPASSDFSSSLVESPYGTLSVDLEQDKAVFQRTRHSLSGDPDSLRFFLVPSQMEYEPTVGFAIHPMDASMMCLLCHWDQNDEGDFEYSLMRFPENAIRILKRLEYKNDLQS